MWHRLPRTIAREARRLDDHAHRGTCRRASMVQPRGLAAAVGSPPRARTTGGRGIGAADGIARALHRCTDGHGARAYLDGPGARAFIPAAQPSDAAHAIAAL